MLEKEDQAAKDDCTYREKFIYMLDSLMLLSASDSIHVRTRAFSTLSSLSTYAAQRDYVMSTI